MTPLDELYKVSYPRALKRPIDAVVNAINLQHKSHETLEEEDRALFNRIAHAYSAKDTALSSSIARRYQSEFLLQPLLRQPLLRQPLLRQPLLSDARPGTKPIDTLVEIACGNGASATYFRGSYERYIGIDYSEEMIKVARWFNRDVPEASFITANIKDVRLDVKADAVMAIGALHHMQGLGEVLESIRGLAKPGAWFVALEPYAGNPLVQFLRFARSKLDSGYSEDQRYFSEQELFAILSAAGYRDIEIKRCQFLTPPFAQIPLRPEAFTVPLSRLSVAIDKVLDSAWWMPGRLSWNLAIRCRLPG